MPYGIVKLLLKPMSATESIQSILSTDVTACPRLLSNGYYILMEDSFLSDEEGNITLTPSQTSVTYKENLVRVFRRRKKICHSLASLFNLSASRSWLSSTVLSNTDSSHVDDPWLDGFHKLKASQNDTGNDKWKKKKVKRKMEERAWEQKLKQAIIQKGLFSESMEGIVSLWWGVGRLLRDTQSMKIRFLL
uniref:Uncharacterized protein n=1 Tax=Falco tinnunculus TaxID=100819 RepID=A0A8C4U6M2_FALTI